MGLKFATLTIREYHTIPALFPRLNYCLHIHIGMVVRHFILFADGDTYIDPVNHYMN